MKFKDYVAMAENGVSEETIHLIHKTKEKEAIIKHLGDTSDEAIISCGVCQRMEERDEERRISNI